MIVKEPRLNVTSGGTCLPPGASASEDTDSAVPTEFAVYYPNHVMEEDRKRDDPMDLDKPEDAPPAYTARGSPSGLTDWTEKEDKVKTDHDEAEEEEEEETKEEKAARRKAKGKAKASPPSPDDNNDNNNEKQPPRIARPTPNPSPPTAALKSYTHTDMDTYRALEAHKALEPTHVRGTHFADADATMNDTLSSVPLSPNTENTAPGPRNGPTGSFDSAELRGKLETLRQRQQQRGDGGRGQGEGWGFAWQETMTREKVEKEGWGGDDDDDAFPSPSAQAVREEAGWEVYDEAAWETAAGRAAKQERRVVALKVPRSSFSVRGESEAAGRRGGLVRAVRGYEAILSGTFLTYERDDVMRVVHRDGDGKVFILLPLKAGAVAGRAHTKDFVPAGSAAGSEASDEGSWERLEGKGG